MNMKWWAMATFSLLGACGPHYTLPNFETNEIDAKDLWVDVRLTDVQHQPSSGPISWIYANTYICTGKVVTARS